MGILAVDIAAAGVQACKSGSGVEEARRVGVAGRA